MKTLNDLFNNYVLMSIITAWISAQILKMVLTFVVSKRIKLERLVGAGGMPSSHSASVCAMMISVARFAGVGSPMFAIAFLFAGVVMHDAMGVRREAGNHAKLLNQIVDTMEENEEIDEQDELKEFVGHTPLEVLGGALLGILISMIIPR